MGISSSRPAIILNESTSFENQVKPAKLLVGPISPRPGPMLLIVAATEVNPVVRSVTNGSSEMRSREATNTTT